jgi:hypothetical protein
LHACRSSNQDVLTTGTAVAMPLLNEIIRRVDTDDVLARQDCGSGHRWAHLDAARFRNPVSASDAL